MSLEKQLAPIECAKLAARKIKDPLTKIRVMADIATYVHSTSAQENPTELLEEAMLEAGTHHSGLAHSLALAAIAAAYSRLGRTESVELFAHAINAADSITNPSTRATALLGVSEAYGSADISNGELKMRELVSDPHFKDLIAYGAACRQFKSGRFHEALEACALLADSSLRNKILALVALKVDSEAESSVKEVVTEKLMQILQESHEGVVKGSS